MDQENWGKLISGHKRGPGAVLLRSFLIIAAAGYSCAVRLRNLLYSKGLLKTHGADAAVFSIGNITTGGTGKTPLVIWLCNLLKERNMRCAILTRGYKAVQNSKCVFTTSGKDGFKIQNYGDEPAVIAESCPHATVIVKSDRVAGAAEAVKRFDAQALIMDDGFQHRRLARDLDIVTIDATQPFGYGRLLPAGLLREPIGALRRADAFVITRCDQATEDRLTRLEGKLRSLNPNAAIARSIHALRHIKCADGIELGVDTLKNKKVFAFCGIGNPQAFFTTITDAGACLVGRQIFDDHYRYTESCMTQIHDHATRYKADIILTTQKDWTKIARLRTIRRDIPFGCLAVKIAFLSGEDELIALIEGTLAGKIQPVKKQGG